jgi:acyl-homoserine-lactone acylase
MKLISSLIMLIFCTSLSAQEVQKPIINVDKITIARDNYGVPHIFAPTDPEVAYGLAWAHSEDDFKTIQTLVLTGQGKLSTYLGKSGASVDYVFGLLDTKATVQQQKKAMDPKFIQLVQAYLMGLEAYAKAHPNEVLNKHVFPISVENYIATTMFSVAVFCGIDKTLPKILNGSIASLPGFTGEGSNAFAISASKSATGEPMLVINAHQPIEGATAFYEAHVQSEEGWNILGGLFPGGPLIFHGVTPNLAWAHTVNYQDKIDVYQLQTDKNHPGQYLVDGEWLNLEKKRVKLSIKGIPFPIYKAAYKSIYGPTVKSPNGQFFSLRLPALMDAGALQQWYAMNRSTNLKEFKQALEQNHLAMFNIMYADKEDNIFFISNGKMPYRNPDKKYNWSATLPGNTRATLWDKFKPLSDLPQQLNPKSGYLFNTNHSPFLATSDNENLKASSFDKNDGYETYHNNRSQRAKELIENYDKISWDDLKRIKFDRQLPAKILYPYGYYSDAFFQVDETKYPKLEPLIKELKAWDRNTNPESKGALIYNLAYYQISNTMKNRAQDTLNNEGAVEVYEFIHKHLMKNFGTLNVRLGDFQRLQRGKEDWPQGGMPDVLAAVMTKPFMNGKRNMISGDAYIGFVKFPKDGGLPLIETVNTFGASSNPNSKHFSDQRELYQSQRTKIMTLDKAEILRNAKRTYQPK